MSTTETTTTATVVTTRATQRTARTLHTGWSLRSTAGPVPPEIAAVDVPATVPGTVHTDLLAVGLIVDPYLDANEHLLTWIGQADWSYTSSFDWQPDGHDRHELVFAGLDTVATVLLNGEVVAETRNQHRTYRIAVDDRLREGSNDLEVRFGSPVAYADAQSLALGYRPHVNHHPYNAIRKMACSFGWDWGLDTATSGIWKPVTLESWSSVRLAAVRPVVTVDGARGVVDVHVDLERAGAAAGPVTVRATVGDVTQEARVEPGADSTVVQVVVDDPELWWPRGHGGQPLSDVRVSVTGGAGGDASRASSGGDGDGVDATRASSGVDAPGAEAPAGEGSADDVLDEWSSRIGFRTVEVQVDPDEIGTSFTVVVNGEPLWIKGANWIPDDALPHRIGRDRYRERIEQAEFGNVNLLRVWGGGIFESDDFYELCDERGMLTWQDFLFACAAYAEEDPLRGEVEAEVRDNVTRLMTHPSLVLWTGNNENIWGHDEWGWERRLDGATWGLGYYLDLLPALVGELDPGRPYAAGSPWSGSLDVAQSDPDHGSVHLWEQWNRKDYPTYRDVVPRFVAEFGWQGPPTWSAMTRAIHDEPLTPESPGMIVHQKAMQGNDKLTDGLLAHYPLPNEIEAWHWAMQLNQANAVQVALEHFRSHAPRCRGAVVWQINDCWPVTSWAAVDGDGQRKPLLYAMRHAFADRLVTIQPRDGGLAAVVVNDTEEALVGPLTLRRVAYDGRVLASEQVSLTVAARDTVTVRVPSTVAEFGAPESELLVASVDGVARGLWFPVEPRDSALAAAALTTSVTVLAAGAGVAGGVGVAAGAGYRVEVTAGSLVRDLALLVDKVDPAATVDEMLVTLLPGETAVFTVASDAVGVGQELVSGRVLRTANELIG
ncbi:glycoside hydrolase family 2 protein [Frigoribacterium sp. CFBP 8751]|uniref:glycoside hydrolase family 2 protein n=1 Tax=Frigoribacterium sp. CFBP 8751 TaxID=2775277 RepID=UPI001780073A|nr:glycoside hydrolase family 2 protein [Frigoribacterium sp. CFBP 8751]MBD8538917.1 glycoside hydrolase family 2 protein [Frigoribacterium sp. CFBP 8751]